MHGITPHDTKLHDIIHCRYDDTTIWYHTTSPDATTHDKTVGYIIAYHIMWYHITWYNNETHDTISYGYQSG